MRRLLPLLLLALTWPLGLQGQEGPGPQDRPPTRQTPSDTALLQVEYRPGVELEVELLLVTWARRFDALLITQPEVRQIRVKFLTPLEGEISWGAIKALLDFHDVVVTERRPTPQGPWLIEARHRRNPAGLLPGPVPVFPRGQLPDNEEIVAAVVQIEHGAGRDILSVVQSLAARSKNRGVGHVLFVQGSATLVMVDYTSFVRRYLDVIRLLDVPAPGRQVVLIQLDHAPAREVVAALQPLLTGLAQNGITAGSTLGPPQVHAYERANLLGVVANQRELHQIRELLAGLDIPLPQRSGRFHVYRCRNASPAYLALRLGELLSGNSLGGGANGEGPTGPVTIETPAGSTEIAIRIVPDERNSSLLIQAEDHTYRDMLHLLTQLDRKQRRIMLEVEIWEISTPVDQMSVAVELASLSQAKPDSTRGAGLTSFGLSQINVNQDADGNPVGIGRLPNPGTGLTAALFKGAFDRLPILLSAIHTYEEAVRIDRPLTYTNDTEPVAFSTTESIPYPIAITDDGVTTSSVAFANAETSLEITPRINSGDNLTLEITLNLSSFSGSGGSSLPPPTNTRAYRGKITVPNSRYVVFGGLEVENDRTVEVKVPFLGDIPILGHLFKSWSRSRSKSKLYIFVRPTILPDEFGAETRLAQELRERAHLEAGREEWITPFVADRLLWPAGYDLQDEAFQVFGTGSGDPFRGFH